jgi:hypothetical protein
MRGAYYRSGQAARLWGISSHLVRRLCEAGQIEAELTDGGQWKIPHSEVERIRKEGIPEIPSSIEQDGVEDEEEAAVDISPGGHLLAPPSDLVVTSAEEVIVAENRLKKLRIDKDTEETRDWFRERQRVDEETEYREQQTELERAARVQADHDRVVWQDSWLAIALLSLPREAPAEFRLVIRQTVADALDSLGPRHSRQVIEPLVNAAVAKALRPWNQTKETERAIERSCDVLPWGAKNSLSPTIWQNRALDVATGAIRKLPLDSTFNEKLRAGSAAVRQITAEFDDDELRRKTLSDAYLWNVDPEERENAKQAVRRRVEGLPVGTLAAVMERERDQALAPFRAAKRRKERVDLAIGQVRTYLERLHRMGETEFETTWDVWNFAKTVEKRIRAVLMEEMQNDDLTDDELSELIEELVDEALE